MQYILISVMWVCEKNNHIRNLLASMLFNIDLIFLGVVT